MKGDFNLSSFTKSTPFRKMNKDRPYDRVETYPAIAKDLYDICYMKAGKIIKTITIDPMEYHASNLSKEAFLLKKFEEKDKKCQKENIPK